MVPQRNLGETSELTLKGQCKLPIFEFFFSTHVSYMLDTMYTNFGVIWRWSKKITFLGTDRLVSLKPVFLGRWFFRPPPNHLIFFTRDLLCKHRDIVKVLTFFEFLLFMVPQQNLDETSEVTFKGHCEPPILKFFFSIPVYYMLATMYTKFGVIWRWSKKITFLGIWRWFFRPPSNHLIFFTRDLLCKHRDIVMVLPCFEFPPNLN